MQPIHTDYKGAVTSDGMLVYISDVTEESRHNTYTCIGCEKRLFPVFPKTKERHFRHEKGCECDYNRYLHEYAKAELKRRFDEGETFIVRYKADVRCTHYEDCQVRIGHEWKGCSKDTCTLDLKKHYDTCTPEKGFYEDLPDGKKRYVADLKLTSSINKDFPPTILEVWVNHECTDEKKNSGAMIIEIKIDREEDAKREITETDVDAEKPIRFYGFNRSYSKAPIYKLSHLKVIGKPYGQSFQVKDCSCGDQITFDPNSIYEMFFSPLLQKQALKPFYFCKNSYKKVSCGKLYAHCTFNINLQQCPCQRFVFNEAKANVIVEGLKKNGMMIWTSRNK